VAQKKMHKVLATLRYRITFLDQSAQQRSLSTSWCKICVSELNILW